MHEGDNSGNGFNFNGEHEMKYGWTELLLFLGLFFLVMFHVFISLALSEKHPGVIYVSVFMSCSMFFFLGRFLGKCEEWDKHFTEKIKKIMGSSLGD